MNAIHLIERINNFKLINPNAYEYDSYAWYVNKDTAEKLVGGNIYFHKAQKQPSFFGGKITSYRVLEEGADAGRVVFRFQVSKDCRDVMTDKSGWTYEKKITLGDNYA
jgi:hypothetical protein